jgi:alanine racemase
LETADYLDGLGKKLKKKFLINIKIDTGISRLGFRAEESDQAVDHIKNKKFLKVNSIFTHYAESEAANKSFTEQQFKKFNTIAGKYFDIKMHSACSAATVSLPITQQSIIRLGISMYGLWPSKITRDRGVKKKMKLKPAMSWRTKILQVKKVKTGETIGYNRTYKCKKNCQVVVLPIGYNEGYSRMGSNKAKVLIKGKKYPVRGNVCMNLTMVELPANIEVSQGEVVTLLGHDHKQQITAEDIALWSKTINYEVVTRINPMIKRIIT